MNGKEDSKQASSKPEFNPESLFPSGILGLTNAGALHVILEQFAGSQISKRFIDGHRNISLKVLSLLYVDMVIFPTVFFSLQQQKDYSSSSQTCFLKKFIE